MIPFTFDEENHLYKVEGQYVLSTSDIIGLCGLCDYDRVPSGVLDHASWRGTQLHRAVELFEGGSLDMSSLPDEVAPYFAGYCAFAGDTNFEMESAEARLVYQHEGTDQLVGCTIDLRGRVGGRLYVLDIKTSAKQYGKAKAQTSLRWRLQLQSYIEATAAEMEEMELMPIENKAIVQVAKDGSYAFHDFPIDDSHLWDAAVRLSQAKLANGFTVVRR